MLPILAMVAARYVILVTAALLQIALAAAIGMPVPRHPLDLWLAFTFVAFAFIGLGLVLAMLADNVPAVQALGQCIFLPMLIIGGVAVPIATLPEWAQRVSSFLPGRYAVEALQSTATGDGVAITDFSLIALTVIGWAQVLKGLVYFTFPAFGLRRMQMVSYERTYIFIPGGVVFLVLAGVLGYHLWATA
jgi:ABC-2 type transport system permease protein